MEIKISSINIRYQNSTDGEHAWENRLPLMADFINQLNLDILGTQEGREKQIRTLDHKIRLKIVETHRTWIQERMYPTLFVNPDRITVVESGDTWLSETPDIAGSSSFQSAFPRLATWMKIHHKVFKKNFIVINVHLDHVLTSTRSQQSEILIDQIKQINHEKNPIILMGDFNETPNEHMHKLICNKLELFDQWIHHQHPEETSHHGFKGHQATGSRIDWILCSKSLTSTQIYLEKKQFSGIYLSDHYPLVATLVPSSK